MKLNREELKFILDDLYLNRDKEIREYNESLYYNTKEYEQEEQEFLKKFHWCQSLSEVYGRWSLYTI